MASLLDNIKKASDKAKETTKKLIETKDMPKWTSLVFHPDIKKHDGTTVNICTLSWQVKQDDGFTNFIDAYVHPDGQVQIQGQYHQAYGTGGFSWYHDPSGQLSADDACSRLACWWRQASRSGWEQSLLKQEKKTDC